MASKLAVYDTGYDDDRLKQVVSRSFHDIRQEIMEMNEKLDRHTVSVERNVELIQKKLNKQEETNRRLQTDNLEMKKSLNEITKQLEKMARQQQVQPEQGEKKKGIAEADATDGEPKVVVAGGKDGDECLNSAEIFSLTNGAWTLVQPMNECRTHASSVVYNNQFIVTGGVFKSMEKLSLDAAQGYQSITWKTIAAELPGPLYGHCSVVYNGKLIVIGGFDADIDYSSNHITEISLDSPGTSKLLAFMLKRRMFHGVAVFENEIMIVGGRESFGAEYSLRTVIKYDTTTNQFKELAPLPYPVYGMAMVKWGDDNFILMGGGDNVGKPLSTVLLYNVRTEKSYMLPDMKCKRNGCVAAVVRDTVIVMGGLDEGGHSLKSVEGFRFDRYTWEELPEMHEERWGATAAVCN